MLLSKIGHVPTPHQLATPLHSSRLLLPPQSKLKRPRYSTVLYMQFHQSSATNRATPLPVKPRMSVRFRRVRSVTAYHTIVSGIPHSTVRLQGVSLHTIAFHGEPSSCSSKVTLKVDGLRRLCNLHNVQGQYHS